MDQHIEIVAHWLEGAAVNPPPIRRREGLLKDETLRSITTVVWVLIEESNAQLGSCHRFVPKMLLKAGGI